MRASTLQLVVTALLVAAAPAARSERSSAQAAPQQPALYVMPLWLQYASADEATFAHEVQELRRRLGPENSRVRLGFTTYVFVSMTDWHVDVSDPEAVRRALAQNIDDIDRAIDRARRHAVPLCIEFQFAVRDNYDPLQRAAEREDRRNVQWYADNSLAGGWMTHSRYARKHRRVLEAYVRGLGRVVANRMARFPETLVAASGDGEVELAYGKSPIANPAYTMDSMLLADYSPFAVAEFRDWLRGRGLYGTGGPFAGEAHENSTRYGGDVSPAADTNRDGHTLNGDFGTTFTRWELRDFDWSAEDEVTADARAIPARIYEAANWKAQQATRPGGFDPPRAWKQGDPWWEIWHLFRQTMIWRHNRDVSKWITTTQDPETRSTVPPDRWYSDQIAADRLFGTSPENPNLRFITSASAWWTADVAPYGRLGITSFNTNVNGTVFRTLAGVAPQIGARDVDWGILEWHPSVPETKDLEVYRSEARLIEVYRPALVVPIFWGDARNRIQDSGFEVALREMIATMSRGPTQPATSAEPARLNFARTSEGRVSPAQRLQIQIAGRGRLPWTISSGDPAVVLSRTTGAGSADVNVSVDRHMPLTGDRQIVLTIASPRSSTPRLTIPVLVRSIDGAGAPPYGSFDAPAEGATVGASFDVAGWALDDVGVAKVEVWRERAANEPTAGGELIEIGAATFSRGTRPDVAAMFPDAPLADRSGWSLGVRLPPGLAGPVRLHVLVTDVEGHVKDLGIRTIVVKAGDRNRVEWRVRGPVWLKPDTATVS